MEDIITDSVADPMLLRDWLPKGEAFSKRLQWAGCVHLLNSGPFSTLESPMA